MKFVEYNENKQHGHRDFPIQLYSVDSSHPQYVMPLHWHKELEIIRVISGKLDLYVSNTHLTLVENDIAFVNCKSLHRGEPDNCVYECIVCDLAMMVKKSNEIFSAYINPIILGNRVIDTVIKPCGSKLYMNICLLFDILKNEPKYYELSTMGALFTIFEQLYQNGAINQAKISKKISAQTLIISELVMWIDRNYAEHITLDLLSQKAGVTPNYLCRIFKEYTEKTPIEYVNSVRIDNVCYEIKWGQKNITEAAIDNGYNSLSYFCKVFKKYKGISAKKYAELHNALSADIEE